MASDVPERFRTDDMEGRVKPGMQKGLVVAVILAVLTIAEYIFAVQIGDDTVRFAGLTVAAGSKAALIVYYFMHVYRVWRPGEAH